MGFGLGDGLKAVATGGLSTFIEGGLGGNGYDSTKQGPMETPEQRQARQLLLQFATNGKIGGLTAGQDVGLAQGNYNLSGLEQTATGQLMSRLGGGQPAIWDNADAGINDLLNTSEAGLDRMFSPFKAIADREGLQAENALKRGAGALGSLYSSGTVQGLGDVAARTNESKLASLAGLTNNALNRKSTAITQAQNSGSLREDSARGRINDAITYGGLERTLQNQQVEQANAEKLRRRKEIMGQLDAASSVSGAPVQFGVDEIKTPKPNPYMDFLNLVVNAGSRVAGRGA